MSTTRRRPGPLSRASRAAVVSGVLTGALTNTGTALAQAPFETTITVRPEHAADGALFHVSGESHCRDMAATLYYTDYEGERKLSGADDFNAPQNPSTGIARYAMDVRVPADAAPGPARIRTESYCGPEEQFPPSEYVSVTIDRARPRLLVSPAKVQPGGTATLSGSGCYGSSTGTVPVVVRWPGGSRAYSAARTADRFTLRFTVPAGSGTGSGSVTLDAGADCPGSLLPQSGRFDVFRPAPPPTPSRSAMPSAEPSAAASASPTAGPMETSVPPSSPAAVPGDDGGSGGGLGSGLVAAAVLLAFAVAGSAAVMGVRMLRRPGRVGG